MAIGARCVAILIEYYLFARRVLVLVAGEDVSALTHLYEDVRKRQNHRLAAVVADKAALGSSVDIGDRGRWRTKEPGRAVRVVRHMA